MMAATGTMPAPTLRPALLQSHLGPIGTVPAPVGSSSTGYALQKPTGFVSSSGGGALPPAPANLAPAPGTFSQFKPAGAPAPTGGNPNAPYSATNPQGSRQDPATYTPPAGTGTATGDPSLKGMQMFAPPPSPTPVAGAPGAPGGVVPPGTTAVSGSEVPYHVATGPSQGNADMLQKLQTEAGRQLDQPTVWDDPLSKQIKDSQVAGINANYDEAGHHLDASLADRGINFSTIAGGDIMDLQKQRAGELSSVDASIAQQRAQALAAGRASAFGNAATAYGAGTGADATSRANQVQERGYTDQLRGAAQGQANAADQAYQTLLGQTYGAAGAGSGTEAGAAGIYGANANRYGESQIADQGGLSDLAKYAAQFFGPTR